MVQSLYKAIIFYSMISEILSDLGTQRASLEGFYEPLRVHFVLEDGKRETYIDVPFEAYNNEVESEGDRVPYYPTEFGTEAFIKLPCIDLPWLDAIVQLEKFLLPLRKNNKRVSLSPPIPAAITSSNCVALYIISKICRFERLKRMIIKSIFKVSIPQAVMILGHVSLSKEANYELPESFDEIFKILSNDVNNIPLNAIKGLKMASIVNSLMEAYKGGKNPPFLIEWLFQVYESFAETNHYVSDITAIIKKLFKSDPDSIFISWCYSRFIPELYDQISLGDVFLQNKVPRILMLTQISFKDIQWFLSRIDTQINSREIIYIITQCILCSKKIDYNEKQSIIDFSLNNELINLLDLSGSGLSMLLPYAYLLKNEPLLKDIIYRIKSDLNIWQSAVDFVNKDLNTLPWNLLVQTFDLFINHQSNYNKSDILSQYRSRYKKFSDIFYFWICNNIEDVTNEIIDQYLRMESVIIYHIKHPHKTIVIHDIIYRRELSINITYYPTIFRDIGESEWLSVIDHFINKENLELDNSTLEYIHEHAKRSEITQTRFVNLLVTHFSPIQNLSFLLPFNESTIIIFIDSIKDFSGFFFHEAMPLVQYMINTFSVSQLCALVESYGFIEMFEKCEYLNDEDTAVIVALTTGKICFSSICWPHVSLRVVSKVFNISNDVVFQYQYDLDRIQPLDHDIDSFKHYYCRFDPPRKGTYSQLNVLKPRSVRVFVIQEYDNATEINIKILFTYIGIYLVHVVFLDTNLSRYSDCDVDIVWKPEAWPLPSKETMINLITILIQSKRKPIILGVTVLEYILSLDIDELNHRFRLDSLMFVFRDNLPTVVEWDIVSSCLLPKKHDLLKFQTNGTEDHIFHSNQCRYKSGKGYFGPLMTWMNGRVFASVIDELEIGLFNFELIYDCNPQESIIGMIRFKQTATCLLSLICYSLSLYKQK